MTTGQWQPVAGTPDYRRPGQYARYVRTERGHAIYYVFSSTTPPRERRISNALSVGGLPGRDAP